MEKMKEMIASLLHSLLYLSEDFADPLDQSQFYRGISSLTPENVLSLYELTCEFASGQEEFRSINLGKIISDF